MADFQISLFVCSDDEEVVNKTFTGGGSYMGALREESSVDEPVVLIELPESTAIQVNYAWIQEFGRYYFIRDRKLYRTGLVEFLMESDPLMSFKEDLKKQVVTVDRNEFTNQAYLMDEGYHLLACSNIVTRKFPNPIDQDCVIFMTVG